MPRWASVAEVQLKYREDCFTVESTGNDLPTHLLASYLALLTKAESLTSERSKAANNTLSTSYDEENKYD